MSYTVQEAAALYNLHKGAVSRWIRDGLPTTDQRKPYLIYGAELAAYLEGKKKRRRWKCGSNEFYCCRCRFPRTARENSVFIEIRNQTKLLIQGLCAVCSTPVSLSV